MSQKAVNADRSNIGTPDEARHERAVRRSLAMADQAAARGDYTGALAWLQTLEAIGHELSSIYKSRRESWRLKLQSERSGISQWFG